MSMRYHGGALDAMYLQCDHQGCNNTLNASSGLQLSSDPKPLPSTGWTTEGQGAGARHYCAEHAHQHQ